MRAATADAINCRPSACSRRHNYTFQSKCWIRCKQVQTISMQAKAPSDLSAKKLLNHHTGLGLTASFDIEVPSHAAHCNWLQLPGNKSAQHVDWLPANLFRLFDCQLQTHWLCKLREASLLMMPCAHGWLRAHMPRQKNQLLALTCGLSCGCLHAQRSY